MYNTKTDTIFLISENSKTSNTHRLILRFADKRDLRNDKYVALSNLRIYYTQKNIKKSNKNNEFKVSAQHGMKNLKYLIDHILHQIFKVILKKHREKIKENGEKNKTPLIKICENEIKNQ